MLHKVLVMDNEWVTNTLIFLIELAPKMFQLAIILVLTYILYNFLSKSLSKVRGGKTIRPHMENLLRLLLRVVGILVVIVSIFTIFELPTSWFLGSSALVGAFLGFGSSQTINNVAAGFYVIISKPFEVKDYVKIGDVEGQVEEISINYTKLYTPTFNLLEIPNTQVLSSRILNCTHEGFIKNTFLFTTPHSVALSNDDIIQKCFKPAIEEIVAKYPKIMLRKPEIYFEASTHFGRSYKFRIFVPKGQAKTMYVIQSELMNRTMQLYDIERFKPPPPA